jgi:hypothetical protein
MAAGCLDSHVVWLTALVAKIPPHLEDQPVAQGSAPWVAYVWIAGMVLIVGLLVWMAVTGRLLGRRQPK